MYVTQWNNSQKFYDKWQLDMINRVIELYYKTLEEEQKGYFDRKIKIVNPEELESTYTEMWKDLSDYN